MGILERKSEAIRLRGKWRPRSELLTLSVSTGIDVLLEGGAAPLRGLRAGLITNHTGVTHRLVSAIDPLREAGVDLCALFGPEHGVRGDAQDGQEVGHGVDARTGIPVYSLYGETKRPTSDMLDGLDALIYDIQDAGVRFYTYIYTMAYSLEAAAQFGLKFWVLDRPNPITGTRVEGAPIEPEVTSFVGDYGLPFRYGLTVGELARYLNETRGWNADLEVIPMRGWRRDMWFDETGVPWVMPSPNLPTLETAIVYPGTVLFEGTNVSEGRGTTRPFEIIGAPWIDAERCVAAATENLAAAGVKGALLRETHFIPTQSKYRGEGCHGFQIHVLDRDRFEPVRTGVVLLKTIHDLYPDQFAWRASQKPIWSIDLLSGTRALRKMIDQGSDLREVVDRMTQGAESFAKASESYFLYP